MSKKKEKKPIKGHEVTLTLFVKPEPQPIPMRIFCECGELHIDEGEYATKPHKTHSCQACGRCFQPALVPTVGVRFLPGTKNGN